MVHKFDISGLRRDVATLLAWSISGYNNIAGQASFDSPIEAKGRVSNHRYLFNKVLPIASMEISRLLVVVASQIRVILDNNYDFEWDTANDSCGYLKENRWQEKPGGGYKRIDVIKKKIGLRQAANKIIHATMRLRFYSAFEGVHDGRQYDTSPTYELKGKLPKGDVWFATIDAYSFCENALLFLDDYEKKIGP